MESAATATATSSRGGTAMEGRERGGGAKMAASPSPFLCCTRARVLVRGFVGPIFGSQSTFFLLLGARQHT